MKSKLKSRYIINEKDAEVTFTLFYYLGNSLSFTDDLDCEKNIRNGYIKRDWKNSETASYISHSFLEKIVLTHFHISPTILPFQKYTVKYDNDKENIFELFDQTKASENYDDSTGAIECTIFKNGYLTLVIRLLNKNEIRDSDVVYYLRQPDRVKKHVNYFSRINNGNIEAGDYDENPGELVILGMGIAEQLEITLPIILNKLNIQKIPIESGAKENIIGSSFDSFASSFKLLRTRPYVGLTFRIPEEETETAIEESDIDFIRKIVVSVGRTTPIFLNGFHNIKEYIESNGRNIYGPGGSIIYIGKRGWCAYDSRKQSAKTFRCGVLEMTHFVIIAITTSSRARRRFATYIHEEGRKIFPQLIQDVHMIASSVNNRKASNDAKSSYFEAVKEATSFLARVNLSSPFEDEHELIEAFLMTHTARNAVRRCAKLAYTNELDKSCKSRISTYQELLKLNDAYQKQISQRESNIRLKIAYAGIIFALVTAANILAGKITG